MNIRKAKETEFLALLRFQIEAIRSIDTHYKQEEIDDWVKYLTSVSIQDYFKGKETYIATDRDQAIAFGSFEVTNSTSQISQLHVAESFRRRGVASSLLQHMFSELRLTEVSEVSVRSTLNAVSFYRNEGFVFVENAENRASLNIKLLERQL